MSHLDFARPGGVWANEFVPGAGDFYRWDLSQSKIVNGDDGGTWAPTRPIILGGAGGSFLTPGIMAGGIRTQTGGRLILGQHDIPKLSPPRTRKIVFSLFACPPASLNNGGGAAFSSQSGNQFKWSPDVYWQKSFPPGPCGLIPRFQDLFTISIPKAYLHTQGVSPTDGQLASVTLNYRVLSRPGGLGNAVLSAGTPFLSFCNGRGPSDTTTVPNGYQQLFARGASIFPTFLWQANFAIAVGQYITPLQSVPGGFGGVSSSYFKCVATTGAGHTGATYPSWNTTPGSTTVDGDITWRCIGSNGRFPDITPDGFYANGAPQAITLAFDTDLPQALDTSRDYYLAVIQPPSDTTIVALAGAAFIPILYTSLVFNFTNIVSMAGWN